MHMNFELKVGPIKKVVFPYEWHFRGINTHLLIDSPLSGNLSEDKKQIINSLARGQSFIGYDLPASTKGFRFTANSLQGIIKMGEETSVKGGVTLQVRLPKPTESRLIRNGNVIKTWKNRDILTHITTEPGIYRIEASINFLGKQRGWIFSNPIYLTD